MCNSKGFYLYFNNCAMLCIFIFVLLYPHPPLSHSLNFLLSFNFLRVLFLAFSSTLCILLYFMHIYTFMQMIRIIHGKFPRILRSINLMKSEANILGLFPKPIILDFFPKSVHQHSPFISNHAWDISCCVGQFLYFHFIPNTPPVLLHWICHDMDIISYLLPFISSVSHWILLLCLAVIFIAFFHSWFLLP